ncbi:hypothetical protein EV421DRAFT_1911033 [Armillaria borealis]|uniref:MYND-type domain-containing protein n=1 Tax=Armillaria borealis TaxID=47425 RepID=A0AA39MFG4_9AGAR|nr:hypothetical protein EV421DRAFT_1911033 [Armillaria borealis]
MCYLSYIDWTSQEFLDRIPVAARPLLNVEHSTLSTVQPIIKRYMCRLKPPKHNHGISSSPRTSLPLSVSERCALLWMAIGMQWIMEWSTFFLEALLGDTPLNHKTSHDELEFRSDAVDAAVTLLCQCTAYSETTAFVSSSPLAKRLVPRIFDAWVTFNYTPLPRRLAISSLVVLDHYIQDPALNAIFTDTVREAPLDTVSHILPNIVEYVNAYPRGATQPSPPDMYSSNVMLIIRLSKYAGVDMSWVRCDDLPRTPTPLRTSCMFAELSPFCSSLEFIYTFLLPPETRVELLEVALRHRLLQSVVRAINLADCFAPLMGILEMLTEYGEKKPVLVRKAMNEIIRGRLDVREDLPLDHTLHPSFQNGLVKQRDKAWEAWGKMKKAIIGDRDLLEKCTNPKCSTKPRKAKLRKCSRCLELVVCSQECHRMAWDAGHKYQCRTVRKGEIL